MERTAAWAGRISSAGGLGAWLGWLGWRLSSPVHGVLGGVTLMIEFVAFAGALVVTAGLWAGPAVRPVATRTVGRAPLPVRLAVLLGIEGPHLDERAGADDTGEIAWARRGVGVLRRRQSVTRPLREAAWAVVAIDGLRRSMAIVVLLAVLFSGHAPFDLPTPLPVTLLVSGVALVATGHWLLSAGVLRPGERLLWSMSSIGAGLGDGVSRSGLPVRWAATMASMVALNVAVSLRGVSDRWTHGLGAMEHEPRLVVMSIAVMHVMAGFAALRRMPQPEVGPYGATKRLEEDSARRLALGATVAIALLGFVAGALPPATAA